MHETYTPAQGVCALGSGWIFLRIGATAFGGLGTTLALIERELVTKRGMLTPAEVTEALTYTKLLPGSTGPQAIAYLGYRLGGWSGSALATAAFLFPSALLMVLLAAVYGVTTALPAMGPAVNGLTAAVVGLLLATTYRLGQSNIKEPLTWGIALLAFAAGAFLGISAALIVVAAGLLGIILLSPPGTAPDQTRKEGQAMIVHLFWRFVLISLLAFGGGGAALPLVERLAVSETGWIAEQDFAAAVAFGYLTPGPVLITATLCRLPRRWTERRRERHGGHLSDALVLGGGGGAAAPALHATPVAGGLRPRGCPGGGRAPRRDRAEHRQTELHALGLCPHCRDRLGARPVDETAPDSDPRRRRGPGLGYWHLDRTYDAMS